MSSEFTENSPVEPVYKTLQAKGKALKRVIRKLPRSPRKQKEIIITLAESRGLQIQRPSASPSQRKNALSPLVVECVRNFYLQDDISRCSPGRKDTIWVRLPSGKKEHQQKHTLMFTLRESYSHFRKTFPDIKIGFTKFSQLRPGNVVSARQQDQGICCCPYCENVKLLLNSNLPWLKSNSPKKLVELLQLIHCDIQNADCMQSSCEVCSSEMHRKSILSKLVDEEESDSTGTVYSWNGGILTSRKFKKEDFLNALYFSLINLSTHIFLVNHQKSILRDEIAKLDTGTCILQADFAENFQIKHKNEVMAAHWSNDASKQVSIFTCQAHIGTISGTVTLPIAVISDSVSHSSVEVDVFNKKILQYLVENFEIKRLHIWTDGAAQHFKNWKTLTLFSFYAQEFQLDYVDWNFQVSFSNSSLMKVINVLFIFL
jgi:hypothetical protein